MSITMKMEDEIRKKKQATFCPGQAAIGALVGYLSRDPKEKTVEKIVEVDKIVEVPVEVEVQVPRPTALFELYRLPGDAFIPNPANPANIIIAERFAQAIAERSQVFDASVTNLGSDVYLRQLSFHITKEPDGDITAATPMIATVWVDGVQWRLPDIDPPGIHKDGTVFQYDGRTERFNAGTKFEHPVLWAKANPMKEAGIIKYECKSAFVGIHVESAVHFKKRWPDAGPRLVPGFHYHDLGAL